MLESPFYIVEFMLRPGIAGIAEAVLPTLQHAAGSEHGILTDASTGAIAHLPFYCPEGQTLESENSLDIFLQKL